MKEEGMGIDVVSPGELYTAAVAGFPLENAYFHGNNKTGNDIAYAMDNSIGYFVCDNCDELRAIDRHAKRGESGRRFCFVSLPVLTLIPMRKSQQARSIPSLARRLKQVRRTSL